VKVTQESKWKVLYGIESAEPTYISFRGIDVPFWLYISHNCSFSNLLAEVTVYLMHLWGLYYQKLPWNA